MKNLKKPIFLGFIIVMLIIGVIIYYLQNNNYNAITEDVYLANNNSIEQEANKIIVHITGEVKNPGVVSIEENARLIDAIEAAGGVTENANIDKINLAYILSDGQKIYVPSINDKIDNDIKGENEEGIIEINRLVNINKATQTELETLTGIGPSIALKIINYRKQNGEFKNIEEIKKVPGIGEAKYEAIKEQICVQ